MIYPPINDLVEKAGNRYSLVILTAKRARIIAQEEHNKDKDNSKPGEQEQALKHRLMEKSRQIRPIKPIIKALDEIIEGHVVMCSGEDAKMKAGDM